MSILPFQHRSPPKKEETPQETEPLQSNKKHFFTILLTDEFLQVALSLQTENSSERKELSQVHPYFDRKDLLEQLDKALQELGPDSEDVTETVFAFENSWLEDGDLTDEKKVIVKELSEELSLEAIGQLSIGEALAQARLLGDLNDSCLLLFLQKESFEFILLKHGELLTVVSVGRSANFLADFSEALARGSKKMTGEGEYFPSKLILTSLSLPEKELHTLEKELKEFSWDEKARFLQVPDMAVMPRDYVIHSVNMTAARLLAGDSVDLLKKGKKVSMDEMLEEKQELEDNSEKEEAKQRLISSNLESSEEISKQVNPTLPKEELAVEVPEASSFGIPFSKKYFEDRAINPLANQQSEKVSPVKTKKRSFWRRFFFQHKKTILLGILGGILAVILLFIIYALFFAKLIITVTPNKRILQKSAIITLDPAINSSDFTALLLKANLINKEISGEDLRNTTGISLLGEKAAGKVAVFNKNNQEKKFQAGSSLTADGDLVFVLNEELTVPAASEKSGGDGLDYGKAEALVTAADIGADYNLSKESKLRVESFYDDEFSATAVDDFSGGSSREVKVLSETDRETLLADLSKSLFEEAKKEFAEESGQGTYDVPTGRKSILEEKYSAELGDEVETVTLSLKLEVEAVEYTSADLKQLARGVLQTEMPEAYQFVDEEAELMSDKATVAEDGKTVKMQVELRNTVKAIVQTEDLQGQVLGKNITEVKNILESKSELDRVTVRYQFPFLVKFFKNIPNDSNRIEFIIED